MMTARTRVMKALKREIPDRVPYVEVDIAHQVVQKVLGKDTYTEKEISLCFHRDHIVWWCFAAPFVEWYEEKNGIRYLGKGLIRNELDLGIMEHMQYFLTLGDGQRDRVELSGPEDKRIYQSAERFLQEKGEFAALAVVNLGIDPTLHSLGWEGFSYALYDKPDLIRRVLDRYVEWNCTIIGRLVDLGFDFLWVGDDIAFGSGPAFSPQTFRSLILPQIKQVADKITIPWIFHSDGNLTVMLDDLLTLGMDALHPIDPNCMDIIGIKRKYGNRICVAGNININLLAKATPLEVEEEVRSKIQALAPGGGYIISSGNSIPNYAKVENVKRMVETIVKYGSYHADGTLVYC